MRIPDMQLSCTSGLGVDGRYAIDRQSSEHPTFGLHHLDTATRYQSLFVMISAALTPPVGPQADAAGHHGQVRRAGVW